MAVWTALCGRYFPGSDSLAFLMTGYKELFALLQTEKMEPWEKIVLLTTCDKAVLNAEDFVETAEAMEKFHTMYKTALEGRVFHVAEQAKILRSLEKEREEKGWRGVCWNQTSVNGDALWYGVQVDTDGDTVDGDTVDGDEDEIRPYNVDLDTEHWIISFKDARLLIENAPAEGVLDGV